MNWRTLTLLLMMLTLAVAGWPQEAVQEQPPGEPPPAPPTGVSAEDAPDDAGRGIIVFWTPSTDDASGKSGFLNYTIMRADNPAGPFVEAGVVPPGSGRFEDRGTQEKNDPNYFPNETDFYYKVVAVGAHGQAESEVFGPIQAREQWYNVGRTPTFIAVVFFTGAMLLYIRRARRGADLYVRPLAGIEAVDEAIGRATEMGKPILYVIGLGTAAEIATIASFTILSRVAKKVAEYQTSLIVPCYDPIVMTVAQETVKASYFDAGRPDSYNQDSVYFVTQSQFAYVAAVNGTMLRELPATNFYLGKFFAESLILAETGALAGSIQIAGTDEIAQIPFFVVACDYTLIGEELYAASAYLGREPVLLGTLKTQDLAKGIIMVMAAAGSIAATLDWVWFTRLFIVSN